MKKILTVFLCMLMSISMATAKTPKKKQVVTKTYVTDIRCENCVNKIKKNVDKLGKGVKDVQVNLEKKEVNVTYDASKTNDANIIKGFSDMKVQAQVKGCSAQHSKCGDAASKKCGDCKSKGGKCDKSEAQKGGCDKEKKGECHKAEAKKCDGQSGATECKEKAGECKEKVIAAKRTVVTARRLKQSRHKALQRDYKVSPSLSLSQEKAKGIFVSQN